MAHVTNSSAKKFPSIFFILFSFLIYLWFTRHFISGTIVINGDTVAHYAFTKYYVNNLLNGVVPLWDPFVFWGRPYVGMVNGGMLNPFLLIVPVGVLLGLSYYQAYMLFIVGYYFLGTFGFFLLARHLFKSESFALIAFVLLLFSGMGLMVFNQIYIILIFVPSAWFFLFLLRFVTCHQISDFLGMLLSILIMEVSYYPFYLITFCFILLTVLFIGHLNHLKTTLPRTAKFCLGHKRLILLSIVGCLICSMPLMVYQRQNQSGEMVCPIRHSAVCKPWSPDGCLQGAEMRADEAGYGASLGERLSVKSLFSHLDQLSYVTDSIFYVPVYGLMILCIGLGCPLNRQQKVMVWTAFLVFLVALGAATPVHAFLVDHIFYFRYFRNLFFFGAFLIPLIILFSVAQLKAILERRGESPHDLKFLIRLTFWHAVFSVFMMVQGSVLITSYVTVILSMMFFIYCNRMARKPSALVGIIMILSLVQPMEVYRHFQNNARDFHDRLPSGHNHTQFAFQRPDNSRNSSIFRSRDFDFEADLNLSDSDGRFMGMPDNISRWTMTMEMGLDLPALHNFVKNKFYLYDRVMFYKLAGIETKNVDFASRINQNFRDYSNVTLVFDHQMSEGTMRELVLNEGGPKVNIVHGPSDQLKILRFDVNHLTLKYSDSHPRFLVYTDSFNSGWRAYIDGKSQPLYRANVAFKGIFFPSGQHVVDLMYQPSGGASIYVIIAGFLCSLLILLIITVWSERKRLRDASKSAVQDQKAVSPSRCWPAGLYYMFLVIITLVLVNQQTLDRMRLNLLYVSSKSGGHNDQILYYDHIKEIDSQHIRPLVNVSQSIHKIIDGLRESKILK